MRERSVMALVRLRNNHRQHLTLRPSERGWTMHDRGVEVHRRLQHRGVVTLNAQNVEHTAGPLDRGAVDSCEQSTSFIVAYDFNPGPDNPR